MFYNVYINIPALCSGIQLCYVERILFFQILFYDLLGGSRTVLCIELLIIISPYQDSTLLSTSPTVPWIRRFSSVISDYKDDYDPVWEPGTLPLPIQGDYVPGLR